MVHTSRDVHEALAWLTELDKEYNRTDDDYGIGDFIQDLIDKDLIEQNDPKDPKFIPSAKMEITLRKHCLLYTSPSPRDLSTSRMPSSA